MKEFLSIINFEYRLIAKSSGALLVIFFAPLIYSLLYSEGYSEEVLRHVPVTIIDDSNTISSQKLITMLNSSPNIAIIGESCDMESAKERLFNRDIYGIIYIPADYENRLLKGDQATLSLYCDGSYFLMYRELFEGVVEVISSFNSKPVVFLESRTLFNPYLGYGTFIMPAVLLIIMQQTMVIGISIIGSIWNRRGLYRRWSIGKVLAAKLSVYSSIFALIASYILTIHYRLFGYPMAGATTDCIAVIVPYILSVVLLGITLSTLFIRPESPVIVVLWTSIPILLISGASLPGGAFAEWMHSLGKLIPSTFAVPAYISVETMGASLNDIYGHIVWLWTLSALYAVTAIVAISIRLKKRMFGVSCLPNIHLLRQSQ